MLRCQCSNAYFCTSICRLKLGLMGIIKGKDSHLSLLLPDMDSNHDMLNQNQLYYPYTIGQSLQFILRRVSIPNLTMEQKGRGLPADVSRSGLCG